MTAGGLTLREQQLAFDGALRGGADAGPLLGPRPSGAPPMLGIYQRAYGARLTAALRDNHEVLAKALGDDAFEALAAAYVDAHPSPFASIRWYGHRLADFMRERSASVDTLVAHPAYADIAAMDWTLRAAFDAADAPVLGRAALAAVPSQAWPALQLHPHPATRIVELEWAVEAAWRALRDHDPAAGGDEPEMPEPEALPHGLLVWRAGLETRWRSLPADEAPLLGAAMAGADVARLCEIAAAQGAAAAERVAGLLAAWLDEGLFSAFEG